MAESIPSPPFLSLPPELRNSIYELLFTTPSPYTPSVTLTSKPTPQPLCLTNFGGPSPLDELPANPSSLHLSALARACKQLHSETHLLYLSRTCFHLSGPCATPEYFSTLVSPLSHVSLQHIRHITLTARISHLRALNESWHGSPFGNPHLQLDTLTIVPRRPKPTEPHYAEIADLSQSHTLAYVLAETLKTLKGVDRLVVRNDDLCFNNVVWRLVYRSLVYRLWRWGGASVGFMFRQDPTPADSWFEILVENHRQPWHHEEWRDAPTEIKHLLGRDGEERVV